MEWRERLVKEDLEKKGYDVVATNPYGNPGEPDFKVFNFETRERFYLEVKNASNQYLPSQEKFIAEAIKKGIPVRLAIAEKDYIRYFQLAEDFSRTDLETVDFPDAREFRQNCDRCDYTWISRVQLPKYCPRCHASLYKDMTCKKCGHKWKYHGKSIARYIGCPHCRAQNQNPNFKNPKGDE